MISTELSLKHNNKVTAKFAMRGMQMWTFPLLETEGGRTALGRFTGAPWYSPSQIETY